MAWAARSAYGSVRKEKRTPPKCKELLTVACIDMNDVLFPQSSAGDRLATQSRSYNNGHSYVILSNTPAARESPRLEAPPPQMRSARLVAADYTSAASQKYAHHGGRSGRSSVSSSLWRHSTASDLLVESHIVLEAQPATDGPPDSEAAAEQQQPILPADTLLPPTSNVTEKSEARKASDADEAKGVSPHQKSSDPLPERRAVIATALQCADFANGVAFDLPNCGGRGLPSRGADPTEEFLARQRRNRRMRNKCWSGQPASLVGTGELTGCVLRHLRRPQTADSAAARPSSMSHTRVHTAPAASARAASSPQQQQLKTIPPISTRSFSSTFTFASEENSWVKRRNQHIDNIRAHAQASRNSYFPLLE